MRFEVVNEAGVGKGNPLVQFRLREDADNDVRLDARNPNGDWCGILWIDAEDGKLRFFNRDLDEQPHGLDFDNEGRITVEN